MGMRLGLYGNEARLCMGMRLGLHGNEARTTWE